VYMPMGGRVCLRLQMRGGIDMADKPITNMDSHYVLKLSDPEPYTIVSLDAVNELMKNAQGIKGGTVILSFDRYEEREELDAAINGWKYRCAIEELYQELFRPRHKHGYKSKIIEDLLATEPEGEGPLNTLMDELEKIHHEVTSDLPVR